jgi:hypothetical protein
LSDFRIFCIGFSCLTERCGLDWQELSQNAEFYIEVPGRVISKARLSITLIAGLVALPCLASRVHRAPTSGHHSTKKHAASHKMHGQQAIDSERVTAIQAALIREHYLTGAPSSKWDTETQAAMLKFQADQGWQTKITPDSRALIKLGLGPDHSAAINAASGTSFNTLNNAPLPAATTTTDFVAASRTAQ